jgi:hypothetical protein
MSKKRKKRETEEEEAGAVVEQKAKTHVITHDFRRLQTIPCHLYTALQDRKIAPVFDHAARQMRLFQRTGSAFLGLHLLRLLTLNLLIPEITLTYLRQAFSASCEGRAPQDSETRASLDIWNDTITHEPRHGIRARRIQAPDLSGLGVPVTNMMQSYLVVFENYHLYGLQTHWVRVCRERYDISQKIAQMVVRLVCELLGLGDKVLDTFSDASSDGVTQDLRETVRNHANTEMARLPNGERLSTLAGRMRWHYALSNEYENDDRGGFSPTPIMSKGAFPFVVFDKAALKDLLQAAVTGDAKHYFYNSTKECIVRSYCDIVNNKPKVRETLIPADVFKTNEYRLGHDWEISPTFRSDGICLHIIWQRRFTIPKAVDEDEYAEHQEKLLGYERTWEDEVEKAAEEEREPDKRKRRWLDKQPMVSKRDTTVYPSKNAEAFTRGEPGLYSRHVLPDVAIDEGTTVYAVDPGMHDLISSCKVDNFSKDNVDVDPVKGPRLTGKEFYDNINVRLPRDDELNGLLAQCSLRTSNFDVYVSRLREWVGLTRRVFESYGSERLRSQKFLRYRKKRRFYDTVAELFPEKDCVIIMGNGKIQVTMKGMSTCPIAKITRALAEKRRVVFTNESYTTKKCSHCRDRQCENKALYNMHLGLQTSRSGRHYFRQHHGLRQCLHCHRMWNRDFNAARNIFFSGLSYMQCGQQAPHLSPRVSDVVAT